MRFRLAYNLVMFLLSVATISIAQAGVISVGQSQSDFRSVQEAIAAARNGDTIRVAPGTYIGQFIIDKSIVLEGISENGKKPILRGTGQGSIVIITADHCTIKGFVIEHCGNDLQAEDSGLLLKSNHNTIEDNELRDVLYGIYLLHSSHNALSRNNVHGRVELEVGSRGAGFHLWDSPDNLIEDNTVTETRDGLYIQSSHRNTIRRNRVTHLRYGLHYMSSDDNKFDDNVFAENIAGAAIMYSNRIEFHRNAFLHNRGFSSFGILFQDCDEMLAEDNYIVNNATGIFLEALRRSTFRRNVIAENDLALQVFSSSSNNVFTENNFIENLSPLQIVGRQANLKWGELERGNFWSDYDGYDLDGNGIGDVAHKVQNDFEYLEGNYPRLRLYLSSPAAQALATAEKTFPVLKGSNESDNAPLTKAVPMRFQLHQQAPEKQTQVTLALISLAMFGGAIATIWKGQRR
ncbi:MAG TPA: nitrous oxide reductase family maturation protein NosD [Blastocatellia bacterium]|nr:nitrous oxide reductase family maturation protein NosD [Blastocatellia bacterium]